MRNVIEKFKVYESHNPGKVALTLCLLASALVIFFVWCITPNETKKPFPPSMGSGKVVNTKDI